MSKRPLQFSNGRVSPMPYADGQCSGMDAIKWWEYFLGFGVAGVHRVSFMTEPLSIFTSESLSIIE